MRKKEIKREKGVIFEHIFDIVKISLSVILTLIAKSLISFGLIQTIIYALSIIICGYEVIINCIKNIFHGEIFDEDFLMTLAFVVAFILKDYFESAFVVILFNFGELLEDIATDSSKKKISGLSKLQVNDVRVIDNDKYSIISPNDVNVGSIIEIRKGERVPIDGELLSDNGIFNLMDLTGESKLVEIEKGHKVLSGAVVMSEIITLKTEKAYKDSMSNKIIDMVSNFSERKAKSQNFLTKFSKIYTPIVVCLAIIIGAIVPLFDNMNFTKWIYKSLSFLVVSCPCALVISVPLSFFIGLGSLAKKGVLIKGGKFVELLSNTKIVAFDKTGTLTKGNFVIEKIETKENEEKIKSILFSLEYHSTHPLSNAIKTYCKNSKLLQIKNYKVIDGVGLYGEIEDKKYILGNGKNVLNFKSDDCYYGTVLYLFCENCLLAKIFLCDEIKENCQNAIKKIKNLGIDRTYILSGDEENAVKNIQEKALIDEAYYSLLPDEKVKKVNELKRHKGSLLYCGDGLNDSPCISVADVGLAMGKLGSEISIDCADVVIMDDDLLKVPLLISHSKKIKKIVFENIFFSIFIKVLIMFLSIFISIPLILSSFGDVGVMLLAVINSLRCYIIKKQ